jgi:hypothetical protein
LDRARGGDTNTFINTFGSGDTQFFLELTSRNTSLPPQRG